LKTFWLLAVLMGMTGSASAGNGEATDERISTSLDAQVKCRELAREYANTNEYVREQKKYWGIANKMNEYVLTMTFHSQKVDKCLFNRARNPVLGNPDWYADELINIVTDRTEAFTIWDMKAGRTVMCSDNVRSLIYGCPSLLNAFIETLR
jgi:hypothetical protein